MRRLFPILLALGAAHCAHVPMAPTSPVPAGPGISLSVELVDEKPADVTLVAICAVDPCGEFVFAGGLQVSSSQTSRLHGLSDLHVDDDGGLVAVTDDGDLFQARLELGPGGRLVGLTRGQLTPLKGLDGQPLNGKAQADAEGLAVLPGGDRLVSFERDHRIWLYPADGGPPTPAPAPAATLADNDGLEALAPDPAAGPDAYVTGAESTGQTWLCRLRTACAPGPAVEKPAEFGLVAMRRLDAGRTAWLLRAFDVVRGVRIELRVTDASGRLVDSLRIARPATVDNFEGLAAVPRDGGYRFYLLSDDNFSAVQRTLLMAYDWTPPKGS